MNTLSPPREPASAGVHPLGAPHIVGVALFILIAAGLGVAAIGVPPVIIVGGSGAVALVGWAWTYRSGAPPAYVVLPPFLLTVGALELHMLEEYLTGFAPAMSRLFDIGWTEQKFLIAFAFVGPAIYSLTALAIYRGSRLAGFVAWFIFIGPGVAEVSHFIFPLLEPAIAPARRHGPGHHAPGAVPTHSSEARQRRSG